MPNGLVSLGYLRLQAQQRSDMENNPAISTPEWNQMLSNSYKEVYDLLVGAYGNEYYIAQPFQFAVTGAIFYPLPDGSSKFLINGNPAPAFYKMCGVDLQYTAAPNGWVSLRNFEMIERNKWSVPNTAVNYLGYTNLKYRVSGNNLWLVPTPAASQTAQIWYVPEPTSLQFAPTCGLTIATDLITVSDALGISIGMSVFATQGIMPGTTVTAVNTTTNVVTLSQNATATIAVIPVIFWTDATVMDGISGWEEYVIIDAILKGVASEKVPLENPALMEAQLQKMKDRIEAMAVGRDIGQAQHVSDALALNGCGADYGDGYDGGGFGWGGY